MSMNICLKAVSKGLFIPQNNNLETEVMERVNFFDCFQTSTSITREITGSDNPLNVYKEWMLKHFDEDVKIPVFAEDDIFSEHEPIGFEIENICKDHLKELDEFLASFGKWDIIWFER